MMGPFNTYEQPELSINNFSDPSITCFRIVEQNKLNVRMSFLHSGQRNFSI